MSRTSIGTIPLTFRSGERDGTALGDGATPGDGAAVGRAVVEGVEEPVGLGVVGWHASNPTSAAVSAMRR
jgi:hypothetical protein